VKRTNALWLIVVACLLTASCEPIFERDRGRSGWRGSARDLEGNWYVNGDRNRRAEIVSTPAGLEARNERGQTSRLDLTRDGDVRAADWERGLRGNVRRDQIEWENGTTWTRETRSR
jgi:hypothetical protein